MSERRASATRGFTLLEVLVAVALLGLVTTVLARGAMQAMDYEGDGARRTRASLLADLELWRIEAALRLNTLPPVGRQESDTEDEFHLIVDVEPVVPGGEGLGALLAPPSGEAHEAPPDPAATPPIALLQIGVRVSWIDGLLEQEVTRTTFAYDASAAAEALGAEEEGQEGAASPPAPEEGEEEVEEP